MTVLTVVLSKDLKPSEWEAIRELLTVEDPLELKYWVIRANANRQSETTLRKLQARLASRGQGRRL